ncbi:folylpolyglutamate synthase/dihydrofolate synthase family protein [Actinomadura sediminis]|uniref:Bifunctional folylpolyglutamate synthase/dihydrofolate synthase n=1 Tax=Actinomadura sediminis TaxID=1038904 RepID=A0ABW3F0D5_9ACTN
MDVDGVFFREWEARAPGERRSLRRARALADALGVLPPGVPVLTVVGSKGKGTAAVYASAYLAAAGLRVCTVTSPGLRSNRDRIRIDGRAVTTGELGALAETLERRIAGLPGRSDGYLSPAGLFMLAGLVRARRAGADAIVLEAGMGGRSDEVSLVRADVAAITPVFLEHAGVLGDTPAEIAREKRGVAGPGTRVVSAPQTDDVAAALEPAEVVPPGDPEFADVLPPGLGRTSAELGIAAARRLLGRDAPPARARDVLASVVLPGRLSAHTVPGSGTEVLVDSAIDRTGVRAALAAARARWGGVDHVLVCLPDHKDLDGAVAALDGLAVTFVRLPLPHLRFTRPLPRGWRVAEAAEVTPAAIAALGRRVLAVGTVYFTAAVLDAVDADTERVFVSAGARRPRGSGA